VNGCKKPFDRNPIARFDEGGDVMSVIRVLFHHGDDPALSDHFLAGEGCSVTKESDDGIVTEILQHFIRGASSPRLEILVDEAAEWARFNSMRVCH
jgi:hypothetical protein